MHQRFSCDNSCFFRDSPPGAEKPPSFLSVLIILWQGIIRGMGFLLSAVPTARLAAGLCIILANWLYVVIWPKLICLQAERTER